MLGNHFRGQTTFFCYDGSFMDDEKITSEQVAHVAHLARLEFDPIETEQLRKELQAILSYIAVLQAVDTKEVPPTFYAVPVECPLRDDVPVPTLQREDVFTMAPEVAQGGFSVPRVLGEQGS